MFISKREADERLSEDRNLFKNESDSVSNNPDTRPDVSESESDNDGEAEVEAQAEAKDKNDSGLSLAMLDDLLNPRVKGRAQYRGKLESQVAIAETGLILGEAQTSRIFELSKPQTYAYGKGLSSTGDITRGIPPKPELKSRINKIKEELAEKAAARLDATLNALSASKIDGIKRATNISKVAKDMAVILDKCTDTKEVAGGHVHFHIFVPDPVEAEKYPTINVGPATSDPT